MLYGTGICRYCAYIAKVAFLSFFWFFFHNLHVLTQNKITRKKLHASTIFFVHELHFSQVVYPREHAYQYARCRRAASIIGCLAGLWVRTRAHERRFVGSSNLFIGSVCYKETRERWREVKQSTKAEQCSTAGVGKGGPGVEGKKMYLSGRVLL